MKYYSTVILFFVAPFISFGQVTTNEWDPKKWEPPYRLDSPAGWNVEHLLIPISFAPYIPYVGIEDIRFTPGWGNAESADYWSYAFLWYLDGHPKITANILESNLQEYCTGLVDAMQGDRPITGYIPVKTIISKGKTHKGDLKTFSGSVYMRDYMANKPIALYCKIHLKSCARQNKTFLFFEVSPKHYGHSIWQSLDILWTDFKCNTFLETN